MERLSAVLERWRPPAEASVERAVAANWDRIVGPAVAANARPREIREGALTVVVPSALWRHELAFHAPAILAALRRLPDVGEGVARLRLRLGRSAFGPAARPPAVRAARNRRSAARSAEEPVGDLGSALQRLRRRMAQVALAERHEGREPCPHCGAFVTRGERCAPCARRAIEAVVRATQRHLFDSPWAGYEGTAALVPGLDFALYARVRARTLERWWHMLELMRRRGAVSRDGRERKIAQSFVALKSGNSPERLTPVVVRELLGAQIYDLLWGVHDTR